MKLGTSIARFETKTVTEERAMGRTWTTTAHFCYGDSAADAVVDSEHAPHCPTAVVGGGSSDAAVSQQDLEMSAILVLKLAVCLSVAYHCTQM